MSLADWFLGRRSGKGLSLAQVGTYAVAQIAGGIAGAVLANVMFEVDTAISTKVNRPGFRGGSITWNQPRSGRVFRRSR